MKKRIIFATGNENKMKEIRMILADLGLEILSMKEAGVFEEIEEDGKMWYVGHSREYVRAVIEKTEAHQVNDLVEAKVTGFVTDHLLRAE